MKIRTLIVDDEAPARSELSFLLESFPDIEASEARTAREALDFIRTQAPDLVFLDIQMPGADGFDVLREARCLPNPPLFVFVTAYNRYAVRAFEKNAVDYLLKPVESARLRVSVERVREMLGEKSPDNDPQPEMNDLLTAVGKPLRRLTIEKNGRLQLMNFDDVVYFELSDRKIMASTYDGCHPCYGLATLDDVESRMADLPFLRINRSAVVNLNRVKEFSPWTGGKYTLVLDDDGSTELTLSRSRVRDFKNRLGL